MQAKTEISTPETFRNFLNELQITKHRGSALGFVSYLVAFLQAEAVSDWTNLVTKVPGEDIAKTGSDEIIRKYIKDDTFFRITSEYIANVLYETFPHMKNLSPGINKNTDPWKWFSIGVMKNEQRNRIINLSGNASYPSNTPEGLDNIFYKAPNNHNFENLFVGLKLIQPEVLDISNIWSICGFCSDKNKDIISKAIVAAKPKSIFMRNTAIFAQSLLAPSRKHIITELSKAMAIADTQSLDISWNMLEDSLVFKALMITKLTCLNISYNFLDLCEAKDWKALGKLIAHNKITHLNLAGNFFKEIFEDQKKCNAFISIFDNPSLQEVDLSQNSLHKLSNENWNGLLEMLKKHNIKQIQMYNEVPTLSECSINNHVVTINKDFGSASISTACTSASGEKYFIGKNDLTLQQRIEVGRITKGNLQNRAAFAFWQSPEAMLFQYQDRFFAHSNHKVNEISSEVAGVLSESVGITPCNTEELDVEASGNTIKGFGR